MKKIFISAILLTSAGVAYATCPKNFNDIGTVTFLNNTSYNVEIHDISAVAKNGYLIHKGSASAITQFPLAQPNSFEQADLCWRKRVPYVPTHVMQSENESPMSITIQAQPANGDSYSCTILIDQHKHEHGIFKQKTDLVPHLIQNNCEHHFQITTSGENDYQISIANLTG